MVWLAVFPAMFWGMYNAGGQAIAALNHMYASDQLATIVNGNWHYVITSYSIHYTKLYDDTEPGKKF